MYRLQWKEGLIKKVYESKTHPASPLEDILEETPQGPEEFRSVVVTGTFDPQIQLKWMVRTHEGRPGYHLIVPFHLTMGATLLVDQGWVPQGMTIPSSQDPSVQTLTLRIRHGQEATPFTPENNVGKNELYLLDPKGLSRQLGLMTLLPYYGVMIEPSSQPYPLPLEPTLAIRNHHLSYALTWYTLALALGVIYVMYRHRQEKQS